MRKTDCTPCAFVLSFLIGGHAVIIFMIRGSHDAFIFRRHPRHWNMSDKNCYSTQGHGIKNEVVGRVRYLDLIAQWRVK